MVAYKVRKEWFYIMKIKKLVTVLSMAAIVASISTMGASAAVGNGGTVSPNAITNYAPASQTWSNYKFTAQGSAGQSLTHVKNVNGKETKVVVEASKWNRDFSDLLGESYNEDVIEVDETVQTSIKQESKITCRYVHSADVYGSKTSNVVVHSFYYDKLC